MDEQTFAPGITLRGAAGARAGIATDHGWPSRIPEVWHDRIPAEFMRVMAQMPAGLRLATRTDSTRLTLTYRAALVRLPGQEHPVPARLLATVDGIPIGTHDAIGPEAVFSADAGSIEYPPTPDIQRWTLPELAAGDKQVEIWLPHSCLIADVTLSGDGSLTIPPPIALPRWVHYGSSISHCLEAESPAGTWPAIAAAALGYDSTNLSFAGSAVLDPFVARIIRDCEADLISLKVGINLVNIDALHRRMFRSVLEGFLDTIRDGHPHTPIVLCTPIACPQIETAAGVREDPRGALTLPQIREDIATTVAARRRNDRNIHLISGLDLLGHEEGHLLVDEVHPGPAGYAVIGERFAARIRDLGLATQRPATPRSSGRP